MENTAGMAMSTHAGHACPACKRSRSRPTPSPAASGRAGRRSTGARPSPTATRCWREAGNLDNLRIAAGRAQGEFRGRIFYDADVYKWLEAVGWEIGTRARSGPAAHGRCGDRAHRGGATARWLPQLATTRSPSRNNRWADLDHGHELYCAGHLFQAAVAFHRGRRRRPLARRGAPLGRPPRGDVRPRQARGDLRPPGGRDGAGRAVPGSPASAHYLTWRSSSSIARAGVMRGIGWIRAGVPPGPRARARGTRGRGPRRPADVPGRRRHRSLPGDRAKGPCFDAMDRQWEDMTGSKLYVTGGVGSRFEGEAFGDEYELPTDQCYCETCAAIGSVMWNWRMLLATGDGALCRPDGAHAV